MRSNLVRGRQRWQVEASRMRNNELLAKLLVTDKTNMTREVIKWQLALCAIVELHKPEFIEFHDVMYCEACTNHEIVNYPCSTIQAIEKELG